MENFVANVDRIFKEIEGFDVEVVAATKTRTIEEIRCVIDNTPIKVAGENRVQELIAKYDQDLTWDFIGQLQTNKVKYVIDKVRLIHSVDRLELLQTIDKEAKKHGLIKDILIEVNTAKEESKGGLFLEDVMSFADTVKGFEGVRLAGIMAVAPLYYEAGELEKCFKGAYGAYEELKKYHVSVKCLSMGMSNDYPIAVRCGANLVRIGRGIFGERH